MRNQFLYADRKDCAFHDGRPATQNLSEDEREKAAVPVCDECLERFVEMNIVCEKCGVRVESEDDHRAIIGRGHKTMCPRWHPPRTVMRRRAKVAEEVETWLQEMENSA